MDHDKNINCLLGAAMALILSFSTVGCLITGFDLRVESMWRLFLICVLACAVSALCFRFRRGGTVLLCLLVPVSWFVFRQEQTVPQFCYALYSLLRRFHNAYGWELPSFLLAYQSGRSVIFPAGIYGAGAAMAVCRTVCRRKRLGLGLYAVTIPFGLCFVVTDTVPDSIFLYLWLLGAVILILTQPTRMASASQGNTLTVMTAIPAALALALLFYLVPRESYDKHPHKLQEQIVHWVQEMPRVLEEVSEDVSSALSGSVQPREVSLDSLGPRPQADYPVMEVTAPRTGILYLRGQDYDLYDGTGWTAARHRTEKLAGDRMENIGEVRIRTQRIRDVLYLPYYPSSGITLTGGQLDNGENLKEYSFYQWALPEDWRSRTNHVESSEAQSLELHVQQIPNESDRQRYRTLPNDTQKWAKEILPEILGDRKTTADRADAIARYVRNSAAYDRNTQRMPSEYPDFARWFLEEGETGYCVHFATAAVVLLRAAGIEARYVEGYMTAVRAQVPETVTEDQAHAWAEYFEPSVGTWVVLEATPADMTQEETRPVLQQDQPAWQPQEQDPQTMATTHQETTEPEQTAPNQEETGKNQNLSGLWRWLGWLGAFCLTLAAVIGQRKARLLLRTYRQNRGSANERALARWREMELLYRLLREPPPAEMEALARKAKYSQHRLSPEELDIMDKQIRIARQRLDGLNFIQRLLYRYLFAAY